MPASHGSRRGRQTSVRLAPSRPTHQREQVEAELRIGVGIALLDELEHGGCGGADEREQHLSDPALVGCRGGRSGHIEDGAEHDEGDRLVDLGRRLPVRLGHRAKRRLRLRACWLVVPGPEAAQDNSIRGMRRQKRDRIVDARQSGGAQRGRPSASRIRVTEPSCRCRRASSPVELAFGAGAHHRRHAPSAARAPL